MSYFLNAAHTVLREKRKALSLVSVLRNKIMSSQSDGDQSRKDEIFFYEPKGFEIFEDLFITGGMGPEAGLSAFEKAIKAFPKRRIVLDQRCSVPDRTGALSQGLGSDAAKNVMMHLAMSFSFAGGLVRHESGPLHLFVACNTAHAFIPGALSLVQENKKNRFKLHSLIDVTARAAQKFEQKVLILSTIGTRKYGLYHRALQGVKASYKNLSDLKQTALMDSIYEGVKKSDQEKALRFGRKVFSDLDDGTVVIAGCTEIPLILKLMKEKEERLPKGLVVIDPIREVLKNLSAQGV